MKNICLDCCVYEASSMHMSLGRPFEDVLHDVIEAKKKETPGAKVVRDGQDCIWCKDRKEKIKREFDRQILR